MIDSLEALRGRYAAPKERAVRKQLKHLDRHCRRFIELSPFLVLASGSRDGNLDASPRGGAPGLVKTLDEHNLIIPDAPGNNRLDSMENILSSGRIGLLFLIPGVDETLRVNGRARISDSPDLLRHFSPEKRVPTMAIEVAVEETYLHCAKALMRSKLWSAEYRIERSALPTMGQMINEQTGMTALPVTQAEMIAIYQKEL